MDCGARRLYFRGAKPTSEQEAAIAQSFRNSGYLPIPIPPGKRLLVHREVGGQRVEWMVDTGARYRSIAERVAVTLKLKREQPSRTGTYVPSYIDDKSIGLKNIGLGTHRISVGRLQNLKLGERVWSESYVTVADRELSELFDHNIDGLPGADLRRR